MQINTIKGNNDMKSYNEYLVYLELIRIEEELLQLELEMLVEEEMMLLESFRPMQQQLGQKVPTPNWIKNANRPWSSPVFDEPNKNAPMAPASPGFAARKRSIYDEIPTLPPEIAAKVATFRDVNPEYVATILRGFKRGIFNQESSRKALKGAGVPDDQIAGILGNPPGAPSALKASQAEADEFQKRGEKIAELEEMLIKALQMVDPTKGVNEKTKTKIENIVRLLYTLRSKDVLVSKKRRGFFFEPDASSDAARLEIEKKRLTLLLNKLGKSKRKEKEAEIVKTQEDLSDVEKQLSKLDPRNVQSAGSGDVSDKPSDRKLTKEEKDRMALLKKLLFNANLGHLFPSATGPVMPTPMDRGPSEVPGSGIPGLDPSLRRKRLQQMLASERAIAQKAHEQGKEDIRARSAAKEMAITKLLLKMDLDIVSREFEDAQASYNVARNREEKDHYYTVAEEKDKKKKDIEKQLAELGDSSDASNTSATSATATSADETNDQDARDKRIERTLDQLFKGGQRARDSNLNDKEKDFLEFAISKKNSIMSKATELYNAAQKVIGHVNLPRELRLKAKSRSILSGSQEDESASFLKFIQDPTLPPFTLDNGTIVSLKRSMDIPLVKEFGGVTVRVTKGAAGKIAGASEGKYTVRLFEIDDLSKKRLKKVFDSVVGSKPELQSYSPDVKILSAFNVRQNDLLMGISTFETKIRNEMGGSISLPINTVIGEGDANIKWNFYPTVEPDDEMWKAAVGLAMKPFSRPIVALSILRKDTDKKFQGPLYVLDGHAKWLAKFILHRYAKVNQDIPKVTVPVAIISAPLRDIAIAMRNWIKVDNIKKDQASGRPEDKLLDRMTERPNRYFIKSFSKGDKRVPVEITTDKDDKPITGMWPIGSEFALKDLVGNNIQDMFRQGGIKFRQGDQIISFRPQYVWLGKDIDSAIPIIGNK